MHNPPDTDFNPRFPYGKRPTVIKPSPVSALFQPARPVSGRGITSGLALGFLDCLAPCPLACEIFSHASGPFSRIDKWSVQARRSKTPAMAHSSPWASLTFSMATRTASMTKAKGFPFLLRVFIEAVPWVRARQ